MITNMSAKDFKLALAVGVSKVDAFRIHDQVSMKHQWAYYAEETESYWLVTGESLVALADMDVVTWAETDDTAVDYGRRPPPRRAP